MINPFWNPAERRLRAGWRMLLYLLIVGAATVLFGGFVFFWLPQMLAFTLAQFTGIIAATWLASRFLDQRTFADLGLLPDKLWWADFIFGMALGVVLMGTIFGLEYALGWLRITGTFVVDHPGQNFAAALFSSLMVFVYVGVYEELMFRGYLLKNTAEGMWSRRIGPAAAIIIALVFTSVLFGFAHAGNPNASTISTVNIMLAGFLLGLPYVLTGRLGASIGLHITWNFAQGVLFGFPVSGTEEFIAAQIIATQESGPDLWTGGAFGPEAGLIGLIAIALGMALTVLYARQRYGHASVDLALAEPPFRSPEMPDREDKTGIA